MRLFELKAKSLPISHHVSNKDCKFPFWVVVPELTFGETTKIIEQLNDKFYSLWVEELFLSNDYYKMMLTCRTILYLQVKVGFLPHGLLGMFVHIMADYTHVTLMWVFQDSIHQFCGR